MKVLSESFSLCLYMENSKGIHNVQGQLFDNKRRANDRQTYIKESN